MTRSTTRIQNLTRISSLGNEDIIALGPKNGDRAKGITFGNLVDSIPDNMTTVQGNSLVDHESLVCLSTSDSLVDINANAVSLRNDVNVVRRIENINLTIDITVSGENGLDTGSEAPDTFYHYFVIFNPDTSTTSGLFSLSSTGPSLPTGFTFFGLVGAIFNDSGSDFIETRQTGNLSIIDDIPVLVNGTSDVTPEVSIDLSAAIPITAIKANVLLRIDDNAANTTSSGFLHTSSAARILIGKIRNPGGASVNEKMDISTNIQIHIPQTIFYRVDNVTNNLTIRVLGWEF